MDHKDVELAGADDVGHLVLSRKPGEAIVFIMPDKRRLTVRLSPHETCGDVRIWSDAPRDVRVLREELLLSDEANAEAATG